MLTSIKELKDHLSAYIHEVQKGEEVIITSHQKPVAKIIPIISTGKQLSDEKFFSDLKDNLQQKSLKKQKSASEIVIEQRKKERY